LTGSIESRRGMLQPEEIAELRAHYGLAQRALARLMDWGLVTVQRCESGRLQDSAHDALLRQLSDPAFVLDMLQRARELSPAERDSVREAALRRQRSDRRTMVREYERLIQAGAPHDPGLVGFRAFSLDCLASVVAWFGQNIRGQLFKTRLAKLLWLADFGHFRREGRSITGLAYARLDHGPMPEGYHLMLGALERADFVRVEEVTLAEGWTGEVITPLVDFQPSALSVSELETLARVRDSFGELAGTQLSALSHRETIWTDRRTGQFIPYPEAMGSSLIAPLAEDRRGSG